MIKKVRDKHLVEFDSGKFDSWCVYLTRANGGRYAPTDTEYFEKFKQLAIKHTSNKLYEDFVLIYSLTTSRLDNNVLHRITVLADSYGSDAEEVDIWFTVIYAGMVAEENKAYAILKKRIKRLGMHQNLLENLEASYCANFSKGRKWRELDKIMKEKGF